MCSWVNFTIFFHTYIRVCDCAVAPFCTFFCDCQAMMQEFASRGRGKGRERRRQGTPEKLYTVLLCNPCLGGFSSISFFFLPFFSLAILFGLGKKKRLICMCVCVCGWVAFLNVRSYAGATLSPRLHVRFTFYVVFANIYSLFFLLFVLWCLLFFFLVLSVCPSAVSWQYPTPSSVSLWVINQRRDAFFFFVYFSLSPREN